jgi:hypothetical protein
VAYTLAAVIEAEVVEMHGDPLQIAALGVYEPWATLAFGGFALVLLGYRLRQIAYERSLLRARAGAEAATHRAELSTLVRDLANTPLQTISLEVTLLKNKVPPYERRLDRIERALGRLRALNTRLAPDGDTDAQTKRP